MKAAKIKLLMEDGYKVKVFILFSGLNAVVTGYITNLLLSFYIIIYLSFYLLLFFVEGDFYIAQRNLHFFIIFFSFCTVYYKGFFG